MFTKLSLSITALILSLTITAQNLAYTYPELDQKLISLWNVSGQQNIEASNIAFVDAYEEWKRVEKSLTGWHYSVMDLDAFSDDINKIMFMMEYCLIEGKFRYLESFAYQAIWEFKMLRECTTMVGYPVDELLDMVHVYIEIQSTVHDQLFERREWFEFEDLVKNFDEELSIYSSYSDQIVNNYFPNVDATLHKSLLQKLQDCFFVFHKSLETGYQSDFELPCDEMGDALNNLILLYQFNLKTI